MLAIIIIYLALLMCIGIYDMFRVKNFDDFVTAGKNQAFVPVFMSLLATMLGASATIGTADRVTEIGFPAFWWLASGAVGLVLQGAFLSEKIRSLDAKTLPDAAQILVGTGARTLSAVIITISWIGIIAAQFVSISRIISVMLPSLDLKLLLIFIATLVILYTFFGGQISVVRTDIVQALVIFIGILSAFIYVFFLSDGNSAEITSNLHLTNTEFGVMDIINVLFITGGAYFLGPDILSRNFISKDGKTARRAVLLSAVTLAVFSAVITLTAMWANTNVQLNGENPLIHIMNNCVPYPIAVLLCLALMSSLLSSADTCLVNAASIIENDILKRNSIKETRIFICVLGIISLVIAMFKSGIIALLTYAYSIYVPGIVFPLFFAICFYKKRAIHKPLWYTAVISGGFTGFLHSALGIGSAFLPLIGMGISFIISGLSVLFGDKLTEQKNNLHFFEKKLDIC